MKKQHIVYVYSQPQDPKFGWELLYSLRSIFKHAHFFYDITIVGDIPDWVDTTKVTAIQYDNSHIPSKEQRIAEKIVKAGLLYDEFIVMHDDMFLVKDINDPSFFDQVFYNPDPISSYRNFNQYVARLKNTVRKLPTDKNYITHMPRRYRAKFLLNIFHSFLQDPDLIFEQFYFTSLERAGKLDVNNFINADSISTLINGPQSEYLPKGGDYVYGFDETGFLHNPRILNFLMEQFPNPCPVEKIYNPES